ncbi:beige/BEACH domain protein (macronuclear) [Tetrahymena thermophila SB210]|uniref:Beige/BEACH domain protein n=1 Tax=Tetrahymena thermophila (strain SB210) TaxID=312017 RepID=W7X011_TETTS|nr:beige/BEACH domain protein [Tetrahymena thermophila SB210]EWS71207.1 beige/BEACH domain protein [Tetrahymena thermophila SB210]|eukprot:XP_012656260.1 beige/BEACH domain protein [Tetrahymena thermophila SB210]
MKEIINTNSISGTNDFKKFLQVLYENLNKYPQHNMNLLKVIQDEIESGKLIFRGRDELSIQKDDTFYSTDVVDHIQAFIVSEELRQRPRQILYFICLISAMCKQDETLGLQIKQIQQDIYDQILGLILKAWSYEPDDETIKEICQSDLESYSLQLKKMQQMQINEPNIVASQNDTNQLQNTELLQTKRKYFSEFKKSRCLQFSCQILNGLDINQLIKIMYKFNEKLTFLLEEVEDSSEDKSQPKKNQVNQPNNAIILDVSESNVSESVQPFDQRYTQKDEVVSDIVLKEKNSQIEGSLQQNSAYRSDNTLYSQQNISMQSIDTNNYDSEFIIDCLLQILKCLEEQRIQNNHSDQCLLFTKSSSLKIDKIRKGLQDFQMCMGFKLSLKRRTTFNLLKILAEKNSQNQQEVFLKLTLQVNYDNINTKLEIDILGKQKTEHFILELGSTQKFVQKWLTLQIIFPGQQKEHIQIIVDDFYSQEQLAAKYIQPNNYLIDASKYVTVIIGNQEADFNTTSILNQSNQRNANKNEEYLFKLWSLNFGKQLKGIKLRNLTFINDVQQSYILSQTISKRYHTLCLNIENPSNKLYINNMKQSEIDKDNLIFEFKNSDVYDHFNFTERHEAKSLNFFSKIFKSSDKSSNFGLNEQTVAKASWKINEMTIKYVNLRLYQHNYPLNILEKIGNMDIFFYILKNILELDIQSKKIKIESKFNTIKVIFSIMEQFNYSHSHILKSLDTYLTNLSNQGIITKDQKESMLCQVSKMQLESINQFFIEKNGFVLLQNFLKEKLDVFKEGNFPVADILIKYYRSWEFDNQMLYRCFVNVILNFDIINCLTYFDQEIILREIKEQVFKRFSFELQKSNKIEYILYSCIKYYLSDLYEFILDKKVNQSANSNTKLTFKNIQGFGDTSQESLNSSSKSPYNQKEEDSYTTSSDASNSTFQFYANFQRQKNMEEKDIPKKIIDFKNKETLLKQIFNIIYHVILVKQPREDQIYHQIFQNQIKTILSYLSYLINMGNKLDYLQKQCQQSQQLNCPLLIDRQNQKLNLQFGSSLTTQHLSNLKTPQTKVIKQSQSQNNLKDMGEIFGNTFLFPNTLNQTNKINFTQEKQNIAGRATLSQGKIRKESYSNDSCQNSNAPSETNYSNQNDDDFTTQGFSDQFYCNQCNLQHQIEKQPYELERLQFSLLIKELIYIIRRLMVKTTEPTIKQTTQKDIKQTAEEKQYIFRRQMTALLVQEEKMIVVQNGIKNQNIANSNNFDQVNLQSESTSIKSSQMTLTPLVQYTREQEGYFNGSDFDINNRINGSQSSQQSRKTTMQGVKKNLIQQIVEKPLNKIEEDPSSLDQEYFYQNALFKYKYLDIIMGINNNHISKDNQYQENVQRYLIDIVYHFYEQFKQSVIEESFQSKQEVYSNFLNQLILRLGENLVEMGEKSSTAFEQNLLQVIFQKEQSVLNQKNSILNIFINKFSYFSNKTQLQVILEFHKKINLIMSRKNYKRHEFLYLLNTIINEFSIKPEINTNKTKHEIISALIESYLYYNIKYNEDPRQILEEMLAILSLFLYQNDYQKLYESKNTKQKNDGERFVNQKELLLQHGPPYDHLQFDEYQQDEQQQQFESPNLEDYLIGLKSLIQRILENSKSSDKKQNIKQHQLCLLNVIFIVEYIIQTQDFQKLDQSIIKEIINLIEQFVNFGVYSKLIYNIDPILKVLNQNSFFNPSQIDLIKQMQQNFKGVDQINGGPLRSVINVLFMLIQKLQNMHQLKHQEQKQFIEKLLKIFQSCQFLENIQQITSNNSMLNSSLIKEKHYIIEETNKYPAQQQNIYSALKEHLTIYILFNLFRVFYHQSKKIHEPLTKQNLQEQKEIKITIQLIIQTLNLMNKQKCIESLSQINNVCQNLQNQIQPKKGAKEISNTLLEYFFNNQLNINYQYFCEDLSKDKADQQIDDLIQIFKDNFELFYQNQDRIYNNNNTEDQENQLEIQNIRKNSQFKQNSKLNESQPKKNPSSLDKFDFYQKISQIALKQSQEQSDENIYQLYLKLTQIQNFEEYSIDGLIIPSLYMPIVNSIDLVSSLMPLLLQRMILFEKNKNCQSIQDTIASLKSLKIYKVQQLIDLNQEFYFMESQANNYDKIFDKKWEKIQKNLESQKGVFYREFDNYKSVQTISKTIDIYGRRSLTYTKSKKKNIYKNHQQYQQEYFKNQQNNDEKQAEDNFDDQSELYNSKVRECEIKSESSINTIQDQFLSEDVDTVKHDSEKQIEDIFAKTQQPKLIFQKEGEYISLTNSYFGVIRILKLQDDESEIIFESNKVFKRPDQDSLNKDDYQITSMPYQDNNQSKEQEKNQIQNYKKYLLGSLEPQSKDRKKNLQIKNILEIYCQTFNALENSVEIFMKNNKSYFFVFFEEQTKKEFLDSLKKIQKQNRTSYIFQIIDDSLKKKKLIKYQKQWQDDEITNFEYLMALNSLSSRSLNDINQYYVFPWIIQDYKSDHINLNNLQIYRNLQYPLGKLNEMRYREYLEKYEVLGDSKYGFYGSHFSTAVHIIYYLIRIEPFSSLGIQLQSGKFDHPDRLFFSIEQTWRSCTENSSDLKELIPEFFFLPDFLINKSELDFGERQLRQNQNSDNQQEKKDLKVNHVELPPWSHGSPHLFVQVQRAALESRYVSENLNYWIDLIWGRNQQMRDNLFNIKTYKDKMNMKVKDLYNKLASQQDVDKLRSLLTQIQCFGTFPTKLFTTQHPMKNNLENYDIIQNFDRLPNKKAEQNQGEDILVNERRNSQIPAKMSTDLRYSQNPEQNSKKYRMNIELEEKEGTNIFFQIINQDIYFVKKDQPSKDSNYIIVIKSKLFKDKQDREKKGKFVQIEHKINENQNSIRQYQNLLAFFDGDIFFAINQKSNNINLYYNLQIASQVSFSNQPLTIVKCINNVNSGILVSVANSKIFLADFDIRLIKKSSEQLKQLHIRDNSVFKNIQILYGHYSPITLVEVCAELDIIVSVDQQSTFLIHNSDGKCIRKYCPDILLRDIVKMTLSPDGYICILCKTERGGYPKTLLSTLYLLDINCYNQFDHYQHVVSSHDEEIIDMAFINYKSMVVCKKQKFEIWDMFMYHFIDSAKQIRKNYRKAQVLDNCVYRNIGLFYDRNTLIIYFLRSFKSGKNDSSDQFISLVTSKKQRIINKLDWACM